MQSTIICAEYNLSVQSKIERCRVGSIDSPFQLINSLFKSIDAEWDWLMLLRSYPKHRS